MQASNVLFLGVAALLLGGSIYEDICGLTPKSDPLSVNGLVAVKDSLDSMIARDTRRFIRTRQGSLRVTDVGNLSREWTH
jgi:hypothetical protein